MKSLCLLDSSKIGEQLKKIARIGIMSKFSICEIITIGSLRTFAMAKGKELPSSLVNWPPFRVTPDLRGCPPRKKLLCEPFLRKARQTTYIVGELNRYRFPKIYELPVS